MSQKDIKSCAQQHLTARCKEHNSLVTEICPFEDCSSIFLCRLCKKDHPIEHLPHTYYLKDIFEDTFGVFANISQINNINLKSISWLENEIGFQFDEIRVEIDRMMKEVEEKVTKSLRTKLELVPNSLELQEHFVKFITSTPGLQNEESKNFISSYHRISSKVQSDSSQNQSSLLYPRVIIYPEIKEKILENIEIMLSATESALTFQMIEEPKIKPFRYYKPSKDLLNEMKIFKEEFIHKQKEEMRIELEKQINIFKEQALDTERYYSQKLLSTNEELNEIKDLWQKNEKLTEEKQNQMKLQYEQIIKELVNNFTEKIEAIKK